MSLVPRACSEEEGDEEWVPARLWNAVKHDSRREREEAERASRSRGSGRARLNATDSDSAATTSSKKTP